MVLGNVDPRTRLQKSHLDFTGREILACSVSSREDRAVFPRSFNLRLQKAATVSQKFHYLLL